MKYWSAFGNTVVYKITVFSFHSFDSMKFQPITYNNVFISFKGGKKARSLGKKYSFQH